MLRCPWARHLTRTARWLLVAWVDLHWKGRIDGWLAGRVNWTTGGRVVRRLLWGKSEARNSAINHNAMLLMHHSSTSWKATNTFDLTKYEIWGAVKTHITRPFVFSTYISRSHFKTLSSSSSWWQTFQTRCLRPCLCSAQHTAKWGWIVWLLACQASSASCNVSLIILHHLHQVCCSEM